ncbi:MAG: hypothetical protein CBC71_00175 [Rhodobacteraceae bacterium TMED111]|nr:MAG: hypothetical protein CBC71_00175 [Rhodobacteraceae bacterium TMED111]
MEKSSDLNSESFKRFISNDEAKRGYVIFFKGEANTTLRSFFSGLFSFIFTRRITSMSSYNDKPLRVITNNYIDRINSGLIKKIPKECVEKCISELKNEYKKENKKIWSQNTSKVVIRARILQRVSCYLDALNNGYRNVDFFEGNIKQYNNTDSTIKSGLKGVFEGFFGGILGYAISFFVLIAILYIIVFIVELF